VNEKRRREIQSFHYSEGSGLAARRKTSNNTVTKKDGGEEYLSRGAHVRGWYWEKKFNEGGT